jgi:hypothetical protein
VSLLTVLALLAPALLLALPLLAGRYVGEDVIERLRTPRTAPAPRRAQPPAPRLRPLARPMARGTGLMAGHLARRPPPRLA